SSMAAIFQRYVLCFPRPSFKVAFRDLKDATSSTWGDVSQALALVTAINIPGCWCQNVTVEDARADGASVTKTTVAQKATCGC
ncbi:MAG: hypothetical protein L0219_11745, partial [Phycisphaerales bacterium]|nr:hypothetical protein [Phycisphaerales bacterium]